MRKGQHYIEVLDTDGWHKEECKNDNRISKKINKRNYISTKLFLQSILIILICIVLVVPFSFASYKSVAKPKDKLSVATWSFKVGNKTSKYDIDLADTITDNKYSLTKVVPGTCGVIQFDIDLSNTKVSALYNISINSQSTNIPENLKIYEDSDYQIPFSGYSGKVTLDNINKSLVKRIYWKWIYTDDDENSWANKQITLSLLTEARQETEAIGSDSNER